MEAGSRLFPRCFAFSALLHASLGTLGVTVVRLGNTDDTTATAAVEVSLVEPVSEAPPTAALRASDPIAAHEPTAAASSDVPNAPVELSQETASPADLGDLAIAAPRLDGAAGTDSGIILDAPSLGGHDAGGAGLGQSEAGDGVRAWLEAHKRYPRAAEQRKIQGEAELELVLDASGGVVSSRIARSSGHAVLDDEVKRMVARATPFPATARPQTGTNPYRIVIEFYLEER